MAGFSIGKKDLLAALKAPAGVSDAKAGLPLLANVWIRVPAGGQLAELRACDGDIDVTVHCPVEGTLEGASAALPPKQLLAIFRDLPGEKGEVDVDTATFATTIKAGRSRYRVNGLDPEAFPPRRDGGDKGSAFEMEAGVLKGALKAVDYAAVRGGERPLLASVCMELDAAAVSFVATDSRRLAAVRREAKVSDGGVKSAVVPTKAVSLLESLLNDEETVRAKLYAGMAVFEIGEPGTAGFAVLATNLVQGKYPNWRQVVPKAAMATATAGREDLLMAVRRVTAALMGESGATVTLSVGAGTLEVSGRGQNGEASGTIEAKWDGAGPATANYNASFLMDPLKALVPDTVDLCLDGQQPEMKALVLRSKEAGLEYVLMPVRAN